MIDKQAFTAEQARREANGNRRSNDRLNALGGQDEHAYSPTTGAVGQREAGTDTPYRIRNVTYPMYGRADEVRDWVSVGTEKPRGGWHWRKCGGIWKQFPNQPGKVYAVTDGALVEAEGGAA